jgi:hypothetical protein
MRNDPPPDFEARIRIFTLADGGRTPPHNGIKWDFAYEESGVNPDALYMIWPRFVDEAGSPLSEDLPLSPGAPLRAFMYIVVDEMRETIHRERLRIGAKFYCHEGSRRVASGEVTALLALHQPRAHVT